MFSLLENNPTTWASYDLPLASEKTQASSATVTTGCLSEPLLRQNIFWFCRLRWLVIGILVLYGLLGLSSPLMGRLGLSTPGWWPFVLALVLTIANLQFHSWGRKSTAPTHTTRNLWGQICLDLLILTVVVHFIGSTTTYVAFAYLFHIALACVFFVPRKSLLMTGMAVLLYGLCVAFESLGLIHESCVFVQALTDAGAESTPLRRAVNLGSAAGIWFIVWYLASNLSTLVRTRDAELHQANQRLEAALSERIQHMLHTTHELKSPFAAIYTNVQLLSEGGYGALPEPAVEVVRRMGARCRRLCAEIQEMLQLANLQSVDRETTADTQQLDLEELLELALSQFHTVAQERKVNLRQDLEPVTVCAREDDLRMLIENLLSNAVFYSRPGGTVCVSCGLANGNGPTLVVQDEGIGIAPDKLPRIFEEYYRTKEAARHRAESTGLGLAIVQRIAQIYQIRTRVESRPNSGTRFVLCFPRDNRTPRAPLREE